MKGMKGSSGRIRKKSKVKKNRVKGSAPKESELRSMIVDPTVIKEGQGPIYTSKGKRMSQPSMGTRTIQPTKQYGKKFFQKARGKRG